MHCLILCKMKIIQQLISLFALVPRRHYVFNRFFSLQMWLYPTLLILWFVNFNISFYFYTLSLQFIKQKRITALYHSLLNKSTLCFSNLREKPVCLISIKSYRKTEILFPFLHYQAEIKERVFFPEYKKRKLPITTKPNHFFTSINTNTWHLFLNWFSGLFFRVKGGL